METVLQLLISTLQIGAVYVLFSLGLTLIFGTMRIVNFAHGQVFTVSALVVSYIAPILTKMGLPGLGTVVVSSLGGIVASLILGAIIYIFGLRYFRRDFHGSFIFTLGVVLFSNGVLLSTFGGIVRPVPQIFSDSIALWGVRVSNQRLIICVSAILISSLLYIALSKTRLGMSLRAVTADHEAAMLQGIPYNRLAFTGFMVATALAGIAGALTAPIAAVSPNLGADYLMKGFIAVIIGGLGSVSGAIVGSLFIGMIEAVVGYYFDASSAAVASLILVIFVLLVRPYGLFGHV